MAQDRSYFIVAVVLVQTGWMNYYRAVSGYSLTVAGLWSETVVVHKLGGRSPKQYA